MSMIKGDQRKHAVQQVEWFHLGGGGGGSLSTGDFKQIVGSEML